jgi:RHS repeat-associated protein
MSAQLAIANPRRIKAAHRRRRKCASAHREYQHTDALGSPVAVTDAAGQVVERTAWEPYGAAIGKTIDGVGYTGHVMDAATGLVQMQQRYYDPESGRFLSVDPVTAYDNGDMRFFNRYAYANNNPYTFVDPDGREGRVAWLVRLTSNGFQKLSRVTREQAIQARRSGENVVADRRQVASGIESAAHGRGGQLKHSAHELEDGAKGLPHYQTEGKMGHSFWGKVSVAAAFLAAGLDQVAEAAEYIPDVAPRPATNDDISRTNNVIDAINQTTGLEIPKINNSEQKLNGFQGVFRVEGRIESQRLDRELSKK